MNRLQAEFQRLYLAAPEADPGQDAAPSGLVDRRGQVRALVLELARPADWALLAKAWQGVQADLGLPAPAIAVSGVDGLQLWFSLAEAISVAPAQAFLLALCQRYLPDVAPHRLALLPAPHAASPTGAVLHARPVPALQAQTGHWSVFVAPDLAPLFADTPWLDSPPGDDGQAKLLRGLRSITPADWAAAWAQLFPQHLPIAAPPDADSLTPCALIDGPAQVQATPPAGADPQRFLLSVMNDQSVALALRIEAAKALLPYLSSSSASRPPESTPR